MNEQLNSQLLAATEAVNQGRFQDALDGVKGILSLDPSLGEAKLIEGVALSQLGRKEEASASFSEAIRLEPQSAKARFNAAVHAFQIGETETARVLATHTLQIEPTHKGARELVERIAPGSYQPGPPQMSAEYPREYQETHQGIEFIRKLGPTWKMFGWLLTGVGLLYFTFSTMKILPYFQELVAAMGSNNTSKIESIQMQMASAIPGWLTAFGYLLTAFYILYMVLDLNHRKGNMLWLIMQIPCSCCGLGWLTLPIYLLFGRK
jgi:tetratricopeptide (TPR) repeat protein